MIALISHASKVMLKILHDWPHHYVNQELPDVQAVFRKGERSRDQIANICWIKEKVREFQKKTTISVSSIAPKPYWLCVDHNKLWKALKEMGIPDHLTCLLRNLYASQEATVKTLYWTTVWFTIEKAVWQGCLLSPCLFNLYAEHTMRNARLDGLQAGMKIGGRNVNNLSMIPL